jgi:hypothetical protein
MSLIHIAKCAKVFIDSNVKTLFTDAGMIITSLTPWLGWAIIGLSIALVAYSFYYLFDIRADVKFKYDVEERDDRRGSFE